MRHLKKGRKLNKTVSHRKAMLSNMAASLLEHKRIETGHQKALELRRVVDRLITYGKKDTLASRRIASKTIKNKSLLKKLFDEIAPKFQDRNGGYTRVIKKGFRSGDGASVSIIELVGIPKEIKADDQDDKKEKKSAKKEDNKKIAKKSDAKDTDKKKDTKERTVKKAVSKKKFVNKEEKTSDSKKTDDK